MLFAKNYIGMHTHIFQTDATSEWKGNTFIMYNILMITVAGLVYSSNDYQLLENDSTAIWTHNYHQGTYSIEIIQTMIQSWGYTKLNILVDRS